MDVRFLLRLALASTLLVGSACNDESLPQRPVHSKGDSDDDDDDDDGKASTGRDAGKDAGKHDAGKDAGKNDAGQSDAGKRDAAIDDDEPADEPEPDAGNKRDAGGPSVAPPRDAGRTTTTPPEDTNTQPPPDMMQTPTDQPGNAPVADACANAPYSAAADIFAKKCTFCHGANLQSKNVRLDSLGAAQGNSSAIQAVLATGRMPPTGPLSGDEAKPILDWLSCGAK